MNHTWKRTLGRILDQKKSSENSMTKLKKARKIKGSKEGNKAGGTRYLSDKE